MPVSWVNRSCFQAVYLDSWWESRDANDVQLGCFLHWHICCNVFGQHFYSDGHLDFSDCLSTSTYNQYWYSAVLVLRRYSTVIMIWWSKRYFQISLLKFNNVLLPVPPCVKGIELQLYCPSESEPTLMIYSYWPSTDNRANFTAFGFKIFIPSWHQPLQIFKFPIYQWSFCLGPLVKLLFWFMTSVSSMLLSITVADIKNLFGMSILPELWKINDLLVLLTLKSILRVSE